MSTLEVTPLDETWLEKDVLCQALRPDFGAYRECARPAVAHVRVYRPCCGTKMFFLCQRCLDLLRAGEGRCSGHIDRKIWTV